MRSNLLPLALSLVLAASLPTLAQGFSSGPPDGYAGNPPFNESCRTCHGAAVGDGSVSLLGLPAGPYTPGQGYPLSIQLMDPGQMRWGFELAVIEDATLNQAGTIVVLDELNTQLSDNVDPDPDYLKHTWEGTYNGTPGPANWTFRWVAPAAPDVNVTFYVAGNAANGNGQPSGDYIYLTQRSLSSTAGVDDPAPVVAVRLLGPSFPNPLPAGATSSLRFTLDSPSHVVLRIFDAGGRLIATPIERDLGSGMHHAAWDGRGFGGAQVPRGAYFYSLRAAGEELVSRIVVE